MVSQANEGGELAGATEGQVLREGAAHLERDDLKLVPRAESIRHRRRAEAAERKAEELAGRLDVLETETADLAAQFEQARQERALVRQLAAAGVRDVETALLVAKSRLEDSDEADVDGVIAGLKKEKGYLFGLSAEPATVQRTSGAKERVNSGRAVLEQAAKKAAVTGSRGDVQEYLRKRRSVG
jgi:hypothetical protein